MLHKENTQTDLARLIAFHINELAGQHRYRDIMPLFIGLCGAQGIGKSTVTYEVATRLETDGYAVLVLSLDDLYLCRHDRISLAASVHPLLRTRGVPGTHDIELGCSIFEAARRPGSLALPRFDKAIDDRLPPRLWPMLKTPFDIILLEGWCVGAIAQLDEQLCEPVNDLERYEDSIGIWRNYVNTMLAGPYKKLFSRFCSLVLLAAPNFEVVAGWRYEQELQLAEHVTRSQQRSNRTMNKCETERFILHYERLTRHILEEMPNRADLVLHLDSQRQLIGVSGRHGSHVKEAVPRNVGLPDG